MNISARYNGLFDISQAKFQLLGCGGIGSYSAINLAKMGGLNFHLYDFDVVDIENIGVSAFSLNDLLKYKVDALASIINSINPDAKVIKINERFSGQYYKPARNSVVLLSFDSMEARLDAVREIVSKSIFALIDARMGAETFQAYTLLKPTLKAYQQTWYSDADGDSEPCNARATSYCSSMAGAFVANTVRKLVMQQPHPDKILFHFPSMMLKIGG